MGDELHVQREHGADVAEIAEAEWRAFVRQSPDFVLRDELSARPGGGDAEVTMRGSFACWTGHPTVDLVPFRWHDGRITVSFGDEHAVTGALAVAAGLDAIVVDDAGERCAEPPAPAYGEPSWEFDEPGTPRPEPVAAEPPTFDGPPEREEVAFDFDGGESIWDRLLRWLRRERRR